MPPDKLSENSQYPLSGDKEGQEGKENKEGKKKEKKIKLR
jgi:hypothetical protein